MLFCRVKLGVLLSLLIFSYGKIIFKHKIINFPGDLQGDSGDKGDQGPSGADGTPGTPGDSVKVKLLCMK